MKWIGLTGGMGTGKSTVADMIRKRGIPVVDADLLAREVVAPGTDGLKEITKAFGRDVLNRDGTLNRKILGQKVFQDASLLSQLEAITHPQIRGLVDLRRVQYEKNGHMIAFYDVPLLFEKKMEKLFNSIVVVTCAREEQIKRIQTRDGWSVSEIEARLKQQMDLDEKVRKSDIVIVNDGDRENLDRAVDELLLKLGYQPHA